MSQGTSLAYQTDVLTENCWTDWNGAIMVPHHESLVARIFANIFVWSILVYGLFFIAIYKVSFFSAARDFSVEFCRLTPE